MAIQTCQYCGTIHEAICPRIKSIEYHPDGTTVRRIEFFAPADWAPISWQHAQLRALSTSAARTSS